MSGLLLILGAWAGCIVACWTVATITKRHPD